MSINFLIAGVILIVMAVNATSIAVWFLLRKLVLSADDHIGDETAKLYTNYLFANIMKGGFYAGPSTAAAGNPDKNRVIRAVTSSNDYQSAKRLASLVRNLPINVVPFLIL